MGSLAYSHAERCVMRGRDVPGVNDIPEIHPESVRREAIEAELLRLEEGAMHSAQAQSEQAKQWRGVNLGVGLPARVLAAIEGATALADRRAEVWK